MRESPPKVITIPAKPEVASRQAIQRQLRVAAYCRVSTDSEEQITSYEAQKAYYTQKIEENPDWELAGIFADKGLSGTSMKKRENFNKMIAACKKGKIDTILTKSLSRFARNTVDCLETVRMLKANGIGGIFEKENINSLSGDGELMLTILASFAQEESRSLSENVKWGIRKRFEKGDPCNRNPILGYEWVDDKLVVVPEEAEIVKRIFRNFLDGKSRLETERELNAEGITTKRGYRWIDSNIKVILTNITYTGNMLLQKEYITDPITKHRKKNNGELPKYYVENTHEAIIDMETFRWVQEEMERRKKLGPLANKSLNTCCFTGKIKCPFCHKSYMHEIRTDRGYVEYWLCGSRKRKGGRCTVGGSINHKHLQETCAKVLGLQEFDESVFLERVDVIYVPKRETLEFHLKDGTVVTEACKNTGHQDCWTEERRAATSLKRRNGKRPNRADMTCFSKVIKCVRCGCNFRKGTRTSANGDKVSHWRCSEHKGCNSASLRDDLLRTMAAQGLSIDAFNEEEFERRIDHIDVEEDRLKFYFRDGHSVTEHWPIPRRKKCQK